MTEVNKNEDKIEPAAKAPQEKGPEALTERNARAKDIQRAEAVRTNASDGSLRKHVTGHQEHDDGIQIVFDDHVVSRKNALNEKAASHPSDGQALVLKGGVQQSEITEQGLFRKIAELPPDKQLQVITASVQAFNQELDHQKARIFIGTIAGIGVLVMGHYDPKIHGTKRAYGNQFHELLRKHLNELGDPNISTEVSYLKEHLGSWSQLGTSRVDIILGDKD